LLQAFCRGDPVFLPYQLFIISIIVAVAISLFSGRNVRTCAQLRSSPSSLVSVCSPDSLDVVAPLTAYVLSYDLPHQTAEPRVTTTEKL
jgi:hypothetical protein